MSGLSEQEILSRHAQSLREARECCQQLAKNMDPMYLAPRGRLYRNLRKAVDELEGSCRQMCHWRADSRWLPLGIYYAKVNRTIQQLFKHRNWHGFRDITPIFENGLVKLEQLRTAKAGRSGVILPKRTDWLVMPELKPHQSLWTPQGRLMN